MSDISSTLASRPPDDELTSETFPDHTVSQNQLRAEPSHNKLEENYEISKLFEPSHINPERRVIKHTEKAQDIYEHEVQKYTAKLRSIRNDIESVILNYATGPKTDTSLVFDHREDLLNITKVYASHIHCFMEFLKRKGTEQSRLEYSSQQIIHNSIESKVSTILDEMNHICSSIKGTVDKPPSIKTSVLQESSVRSKDSGSSFRSKSSSSLARYRAKALEAKARLDFEKLEHKLKLQRAMLEEEETKLKATSERKKAQLTADIHLLNQKKEVAAAEANLRAYEEDSEGESSTRLSSVPEQDSMKRTEQFIQEHFNEQPVCNVGIQKDQPSHITPIPDLNPNSNGLENVLRPISELRATAQEFSPPKQLGLKPMDTRPCAPVSNHEPEAVPPTCTSHTYVSPLLLSTNAPYFPPNLSYTQESLPRPPSAMMAPSTYIPRPVETERTDLNHKQESNPTDTVTSSGMREITKYIMKRDLLLHRLTTYNDKPEHYSAWKGGFKAVVSDLEVTPAEEIELLVKYLGNESKRHAESLRSSNAANPSAGLIRVWQRLDERYGAPELVEASMRDKLTNFPRLNNKDTKRLYDLADILSEIESIKEQENYCSLMAYYDSSVGVIPIVEKLPPYMQSKWTDRAARYKKDNPVGFPPFKVFCNFVREFSSRANDPSLIYKNEKTQVHTDKGKKSTIPVVSARKTDIPSESEYNSQPSAHKENLCPLHDTRHTLNECRAFQQKPIAERRQFMKEKGICFRCCKANRHIAKDCKEKSVLCSRCKSTSHCTALHDPSSTSTSTKGQPFVSNIASDHGGEDLPSKDISSDVNAKCTQLCGKNKNGKSCAKTVLARVYPKESPERHILLYVIIDDQSNRSLATTSFFETFQECGCESEYVISSCAGQFVTSGRRASGYMIESIDGSATMTLPNLIECNEIPNARDEIPTPEVALYHEHLRDISKDIPQLQEGTEIMLLIGRDLIEAHHVLDQRLGPKGAPFAQRLNLGWVVIGEVCLGIAHNPNFVQVSKTQILGKGRPTILVPCTSSIHVNDSVFRRTPDDDKPGLSVDDREFMEIMEGKMKRNENGNWEAPLPFRRNGQPLPNNKSQAMDRAKSLTRNLSRNPGKKEHFCSFMKNMLDRGHAEIAPPISNSLEQWYLPIFGVYHKKKTSQIRVVFDSSATYQGVSLNSALLTGPDLTNSLLGILIRFRKDRVAFVADIQQMFHCFFVTEEHRNFLRFFWHSENNPDKPLTEYRMKVHTFGNAPSPAIATFGLRKSVEINKDRYGEDVYEFVNNNFYVDDGLSSRPDAESAIDLLKRTQKSLLEGGNLRLHKISSNSRMVMDAFPSDDLAQNLQDLNFDSESPPLQRSLGIYWDIVSDEFTFQVSAEEKPFTKRGVLSTVNSLYDPLGFLSPVIIRGKLFLRKLMNAKDLAWDDPLPHESKGEWETWRESLRDLEGIRIPRTYTDNPRSEVRRELHIFSDASVEAIAAVAYLRTFDHEDKIQISHVLGKAKVAPMDGHTIPRLELCAAVLATQILQIVLDNSEIEFDEVKLYSDSRVVLGYIHNTTRRFYVYVANRVERIRRITTPEQWLYISTDQNPADQGTRSIPSTKIQESVWLKGPPFLTLSNTPTENPEEHELVNEDSDKEIRPLVQIVKTNSSEKPATNLGSHRFEKFSDWITLIRSISILKHIARSFRKKTNPNSTQHTTTYQDYRDSVLFHQAKNVIIMETQKDFYMDEFMHLTREEKLRRDSPIISLSPYIDSNGVMRVGGRLNRLEDISNQNELNPIIIPGKSHVGTLIVRYYHASTEHQGRHLTEGAVRTAGFWIVGCRRLVNSIIHHCVKCRKLRGQLMYQKMSDLPLARVTPSAPFTFVGLDVFGPWQVTSRRTRGGLAHSKRWAVIFTCLASRAIHIEVVEDMTSSAFINALRRFVSIRGEVQELYSDRGTNFVGSTNDLKIDTINVGDGPVKDFLYRRGITWKFNSPHSSHMGGVWERMIGLSRRILDSMLLEHNNKNLTHEVLTTLMYEVCAILNARPIISVSNDSDSPQILSPSVLLTQKTGRVEEPFQELGIRDMYKAQWKHVQVLANSFWSRWQKEYLHTLQRRKKWQSERQNVKTGDVVLLKDKNTPRNDWSVSRVVDTFSGEDNLVRKVKVKVIRDGITSYYIRPVTDLVLILSE